jgi:glycosyltransferase involved in cell wall biosynthesis
MAPDRIAFVCPRLVGDGAVGGAETLLKNLALHAAARGMAVDFLTTCAQSHYTWENTLPPGVKRMEGMDVHFFPVDPRDAGTYLRIQGAIDRGHPVSPDDELLWLRNGVNSAALLRHLERHAAGYRAIVLGPYLFGLTWFTALAHPERSLLVPCLHDEPFAKLACMKRLFAETVGCLFNAPAERDLARELFAIPDAKSRIVGMGLDPFDADPAAFAGRHRLSAPYLLYSGRREPLKGTPLLCDYVHAFRERTRRDVKLVFTGSGAIDAPAGLWPHVLDAGFVAESEKHEAMAGALAFVHPSVNESFGIVLLEAFLARTPGLVHAKSRVLVGQCRAAQAGLWFRHYADFETQLLHLLDHPDDRAALGQNGRRHVAREYAWPVIEDKFLAALDALVPAP